MPLSAPLNPANRTIWEISANFHCSIVGTCLTIAEQHRIIHKANLKAASDYEAHGWIVHNCSACNRISQGVTRLLNTKYSRELREVAWLNPMELPPYWEKHLANEDICGPYWAILSHPGPDERLANRIFGDVHMRSHYLAACRRSGQRQLKDLQQECQHLKQKSLAESDKRTRLLRQIAELEDRLRSREEARPCPGAIPADRQPADQVALQQKIERQRQIIADLQRQRKDHEALRQRLAEQENLNAALNRQLTALIEDHQPPRICPPDCPAYATCARRILLVGGITKMAAHYRAVVTRHGDSFDHHDGCMRDGEDALEGKINRCDLVLCPVDVNSHGACLSVKKICKRLNKPYRMLPSSSLSTVARTLEETPV